MSAGRTLVEELRAVPILDGTLPYYTEFVPTPAATATTTG